MPSDPSTRPAAHGRRENETDRLKAELQQAPVARPVYDKPQILQGKMTKLGLIITVIGMIAGVVGVEVPTDEAKDLAHLASDNWELVIAPAIGLLVAAYGKIRRNWRTPGTGSAVLMILILAAGCLVTAVKGAVRPVSEVAGRIALLCSMMWACVLSSCVAYKDGDRYFGAVGTDAKKVKVNSEGLEIEEMNNSIAFKETSKLVQKIWNSYLTLAGLKFVSGLYYNHQGKIVDQATTVKLEELRNANSVDMANLKLEELKLMQGAGAGG